MKTILYNQKEIKVLNSCDVLVIGGGTSGVVVALSALNQKQSVIILEKGIYLGGSETRALVHPFMATKVGGGTLTKELNEEFLKYSPDSKYNAGPYALSFNGEDFATFYDQKIRESKGQIYYDATFIDVIKENNKISYAIAYIHNDLYAIEAKTFVDTTAEALVSKAAGVPIDDQGENGMHQSVSLRFEMANVDYFKLCDFLRSIQYQGFGIPAVEDSNHLEFIRDKALIPYFEKAIQDGVITSADVKYIQGFAVPGKPNVMSFNCPELPNCKDVNTPDGFSYYASEGRMMVQRFSRFLKGYIPGFENAFVSKIADMLGIRESVRIIGDYVLTEKDYLNQAKFKDGIAKADWYVDVHHDHEIKEEDLHRYQPGEYYEIPYRCLISKHCDNLIVGGRHLSCSFRVEASVRIQATLRDIAEVIGKACAYSNQNHIDLNKINGEIFKCK